VASAEAEEAEEVEDDSGDADEDDAVAVEPVDVVLVVPGAPPGIPPAWFIPPPNPSLPEDGPAAGAPPE
jgi:hypothetical protein